MSTPRVIRTDSLATAAQFPSGDNTISRIGNVHLVSILSKLYVSSEYMQTVPSSDPVMKKPFYPSISLDRSFNLLTPTDAATAVLLS
jgi:hypothetical protein